MSTPTLTDYRRAAARSMSEAQLAENVRAAAKVLGVSRYHTHDSRRSDAGFPDEVLVGTAIIYRELKSERGKVSTQQIAWIEALRNAGADAGIWRPSDWLAGRIQDELRAISGRR